MRCLDVDTTLTLMRERRCRTLRLGGCHPLRAGLRYLPAREGTGVDPSSLLTSCEVLCRREHGGVVGLLYGTVRFCPSLERPLVVGPASTGEVPIDPRLVWVEQPGYLPRLNAGSGAPTRAPGPTIC